MAKDKEAEKNEELKSLENLNFRLIMHIFVYFEVHGRFIVIINYNTDQQST